MDQAHSVGRAMKQPGGTQQINVQDLLMRQVVTAEGKKLGRIVDLVAERRGEDLCITQLVVGPSAWLTRFGWKRRNNARTVSWERITSLHPDVRVREEGGRQ
jgi:sporulation protein YlmC with PRC-barrel domain